MTRILLVELSAKRIAAPLTPVTRILLETTGGKAVMAAVQPVRRILLVATSATKTFITTWASNASNLAAV